MMYHRIDCMCKEVHELVQWCLKMKVRVPLSVGEKPNLQPAVFHKIRMNQGPVENSDDQVNGRRHILMRGYMLCAKSAHEGFEFDLKTPGELV